MPMASSSVPMPAISVPLTDMRARRGGAAGGGAAAWAAAVRPSMKGSRGSPRRSPHSTQ